MLGVSVISVLRSTVCNRGYSPFQTIRKGHRKAGTILLILKAFMIVQIYETQNCEEAKKLVEVGVDHIGVLVGNGEYPRELGLEQAKDIFRCVTGHAKRVVLSLSKNLQAITEIVNKINPHILHLGTAPESLSPEDVHTLKQQFPNLKIMRSIPVNDETSVELAKQYDRVADYLLLDTQKKDDTQVGARERRTIGASAKR